MVLICPYLEGQLEVLAAPDVEAGVVGSQALEELAVDGEEPPGHGGRGHGLGGAVVTLPLPLGDRVPVELEEERITRLVCFTGNAGFHI